LPRTITILSTPCLSRLLPWFHETKAPFALDAITGQYVGRGQLRIETGQSHMRLRVRAADIPRALPLAGKAIELGRQRIRFGVPHVEALQPAPDLIAHTVTIKHATEADTFVQSARKQLDDLGIAGTPEVPLVPFGPRKGQPMRQVLRIKDAVIVCFPLRVRGLKPEESLKLQESGLGGKRHMGGGFFLPATA
jgi:CRISPR-associated protein Cas6